MLVANGSQPRATDSLTLFAFDNASLPNSEALRINLVAAQRKGDGFPNPSFSQGDCRVLGLGQKGASDDALVIYYGNVFKGPDGLLWMYYLGMGSTDPIYKGQPPHIRLERLHLAKSKDGKQWDRPSLGLVDYNGSKDNNLVAFSNPDAVFLAACVIFVDPTDPDASKRFKMVWENQGMNPKISGNTVTSTSADGLTWTAIPNTDFHSLEMSGGVILEEALDGTPKRYLIAGHGGSHYPAARRMVIYQSYDFESWESTTTSGFCRTPLTGPDSLEHGPSSGEQCHLGAALSSRAGVVLGMYGQWHGNKSNDRRMITMDLGLIISNDGLHYREPVKDFRLIPCAEDCSTLAEAPWAKMGQLTPMMLDQPANVQGNGMENVGDETLFWYGKWPEVSADGVRCASWERDRLGYLSMDPALNGLPTVISCPINLQGKEVKVSLNVDGVSKDTTARVQMLTEQFKPIPGYCGEHAAAVTQPSLRHTVQWDHGGPGFALEAPGRIRVKVTFEGSRPEDVKLYAIYIDDASVEGIPGLYVPPEAVVSPLEVEQSVELLAGQLQQGFAWGAVLDELIQMGFSDCEQTRAVVAEVEGDLKQSVKLLIASERSGVK